MLISFGKKRFQNISCFAARSHRQIWHIYLSSYVQICVWHSCGRGVCVLGGGMKAEHALVCLFAAAKAQCVWAQEGHDYCVKTTNATIALSFHTWHETKFVYFFSARAKPSAQGRQPWLKRKNEKIFKWHTHSLYPRVEIDDKISVTYI